jgi:hypothetical protein
VSGVSTGSAAEVRLWGGFEIAYVDGAGVERCEVLSRCRDAEFERARPVRGFASFKGQSHFPGLWWFSAAGDHVGFESWLERDVVMLLDADPAVAAVVSQPFWLSWPDGKRTVRHAPDFFARRRDGSAVVIDVRADDRIEDSDAVKFEMTGRACALAGWEYQRIGALDPVLAANLRWLAGYRHPRYAVPGCAADLARVFASPLSLMDGARAAGDPIAVLPVLFSLLWRRRLLADLATSLLGPGTLVWSPGGRR